MEHVSVLWVHQFGKARASAGRFQVSAPVDGAEVIARVV